MANRFYTVMLIPERSSRVKKWIIPTHLVRWVVSLVVVFILGGLITSFMTLRYIAKKGQFQQALLKNHYLEGQLEKLRNKVSTADATIVRIQNFEQKLRMVANLDQQHPAGGIGPISDEEEQILLHGDLDSKNPVLASSKDIPKEYSYKTRSLELTIEGLRRKATLQEQSLQELYELIKDQQAVLSSKPSIWPVRGWVTSRFGYRISPFTGLRQMHEGIDISAHAGTQVISPADGVIARVGTDPGYGKLITVNHGYGVVTRYGHNSEVLVRVGQRIRRGSPIAKVGNTGRATGPHLHYEIRVNGIPVNPTRYILN